MQDVIFLTNGTTQHIINPVDLTTINSVVQARQLKYTNNDKIYGGGTYYSGGFFSSLIKYNSNLTLNLETSISAGFVYELLYVDSGNTYALNSGSVERRDFDYNVIDVVVSGLTMNAAMITDDTYMYIKDGNYLKKYRKSDKVLVATSASISNIEKITNPNNGYLYCFSNGVGLIYKLDISDLSTIGSVNTGDGTGLRGLSTDGNDIFSIGANNIKKYDLNLNYSGTTIFTGNTNNNGIVCMNGYVYVSTQTALYKLDVSDLSVVTTRFGVIQYGYLNGGNLSFTSPPIVVTSGVTVFNNDTATLAGAVTDIGSSAVTVRGFCYNTTGSPTTGDTYVTSGSGLGSFTVNVTMLTSGTTYYVKAYAINSEGIAYGNEVSFTTTSLPIPTVITYPATLIKYNQAGFGGECQSLNGAGCTTHFGFRYGTTTGTTLQGLDSTYSYCTTFAWGGSQPNLFPCTTYYYRAYVTNVNGTGYGNIVSFTTAPWTATVFLSSISDIEDITATANYTAGGYPFDICPVLQRGTCWSSSHQNPTTGDTHTNDGTGYGSYSSSLTGLTGNVLYYVRSYTVTAAGITYSNQRTFMTVAPILIPFCDAVNYEITQPSTCGNLDGILWIENLAYFTYYDFTLLDAFGNSYAPNLTTGEFTGLAAGWYFLAVIPFPQYQYIYGTETCFIPWIAVIDIDTPMVLDSVSIKPAQCQIFDKSKGRIYYKVSGFNTGHTYSFYAWSDNVQPYITPPTYYQKLDITSSNDIMIPEAASDCYYALLVDETTSCHLVLDVQCISDSELLFSLGGLKKLWIAPWGDDIDTIYWKSSDDDYFLEFADTSFFTSTKITEFYSHSGGTIQWYTLPIAPQVVKLSQKLNKVRQGFIFEDVLDCAISAADAFKWQEIQPIVNIDNKWIVVVIDDNDFAWTSGYRHGARVSVFKNQTGNRGEDNGYTMSFTSQSENKILTAIDKTYITNHII
jgi:hypothetical protein